MKKILFASAIAAIALSGCSNEITESFDTQKVVGPKEIGIDVYAKGTTRAVATTTIDNLKSPQTGFELLIKETTNVIYNGSVSFSNSAFGYDNADHPVCWPDDATKTVNFYGVYGSTSAFADNSTSCLVALEDWARDTATDVVVAKAEGLTQSSTGVTDGTVTLSFNHILSMVSIKMLGDAGYEYSVSALSLSNNTAVNTYDVATGTWSNDAQASDTPAVSKYEFVSENISFYDNGNTFNFTGAGTTAIDLKDSNTQGDDRSMLLVPGTYTLSITYTVTIGGLTSEPVTKTASVTLAAGTKNVLSLSLPFGKPIGVSASVTDWPTDATNTTPTLQ